MVWPDIVPQPVMMALARVCTVLDLKLSFWFQLQLPRKIQDQSTECIVKSGERGKEITAAKRKQEIIGKHKTKRF